MPRSDVHRWDATVAWGLLQWTRLDDIRNRELPEKGKSTSVLLVRPTEAPPRDRVKNEPDYSSNSRQRDSWRRPLVRQASPFLGSRSQPVPSPGMPRGQAVECQVCDGLVPWLDQH